MLRSLFQIAYALIWLLYPISLTSAATLDYAIASDPIVLQSQQLLSPTDRRQLALDLHKHFSKLDSSFADNTPDELAWLQKNYFDELKRNGNHITNKSMQALESRIYAVYETKGYISDSMSLLDQILNGFGNNPKLEAIYWMKLASALSDNASYAGKLYQLSDKNSAMKEELNNFAFSDSRWEQYAGNLSLRASEIIEKICLPILISASKNLQDTP